jgi:uncharacterized membrane protein YhhN
MQWDLGLSGLGLLLVMSLAFGLIAHVVLFALGQMPTRWLWAVGAAAYFLAGLFISEVMFGWATEDDLQPNVDGLSFDEVLLFALVPGVVAVLVTWYVARRGRSEVATSS